MNLRYTLLSAVALTLAGGAMAQRAVPRAARMDFRPLHHAPQTQPDDEQRDGGDVVWSEDFANGMAGNNPSGAWTLDGANGDIWKYTHTGPVGAYSEVGQKIVSPSVNNGFMLFGSDSANTNWGVTPPAIVANPVNWDGSLVSPVIDLSATPYVEIAFAQRLRFCCDGSPNFLDVSTDGGNTWPFTFNTSEGIAVNADPGTQTRRINITAAISANPANVKLRFHHNSEGGSSHYHWQIDDIQIVEVYEYDLRVTTNDITAWDVVTSATYDSIHYSVYPFSQLRPMGLNLTVLNNGSADQTDVMANFTVQRQGGPVVLDQDQAVPTLMAGETRRVFVSPDFTPPAEAGTYLVNASVTSGATDNVPGDNAGTEGRFGVAEYVYARDGGTIADFEDGDAAGGVLILGNIFHIQNEVELTAVSVALRSGAPSGQTSLGTLIQGELRTLDEDFSLIESTQEVIITQQMLNGANGSNFTQLIFDNPVLLEAGQAYLLTVQAYGYARLGTNGTSEEQTSFIYYVSPTQGENWFFTTITPMVRMNFDPTVGIEDADRNNGVGLGQNMPNPSINGTTTIPYELANAAPVTLTVRDLSGKVVMEQYEGKRGAGVYRLELNTGGLSEGAYTYTLSAGDVRMTKRMTVIH
jgi:hypothetical protein